MKVVLFCGGLGMRIRDYSDTIPKPMVPIGHQPVLWHLMKYYAHYGHKDFILCLGYKGDVIKQYFLNYQEALSNDFVLKGGGKIELMNRDIDDWRITLVDTGQTASVGERLKAVEGHLEGEEMFMANYADALTDLPLPKYLEFCRRKDRTASFACVRPAWTFHVVSIGNDAVLEDIHSVRGANLWINGGFFVLKKEIFRYIQPGEDFPVPIFKRLLKERQVAAYKYQGFWACMDTFREKRQFDEMYASGNTPWQVWDQPHRGRAE